jgi:LysR family cyn operon transcriptional activator
MELRHLRSFLALVKHHRFSRAAEAVELSQPALSQQIKQLEDELGVTLVVRDPMGAILTPAGEEFRGYARRMLDELEEAKKAVHAPGLKPADTLGVGYSPAFCHTVVEAVACLRIHAPDLSIRLEEAGVPRIERRLRDGRLDIGVVADWKPKTGMMGIRYAEMPLRLIVHPKHRLGDPSKRYERFSLETVAGERFVLPRAGTRARQTIDNSFATQNIAPRVAVETSDVNTAMAVVAQSEDLVSVLPVPGPYTLDMRGVTALLLVQPLPPGGSCVIFRGSQIRSGPAQQFAEQLHKQGVFLDPHVVVGPTGPGDRSRAPEAQTAADDKSKP